LDHPEQTIPNPGFRVSDRIKDDKNSSAYIQQNAIETILLSYFEQQVFFKESEYVFSGAYLSGICGENTLICGQILKMKKLALSLFLLITASAVILFQSCQSTKSSTATKMLKFNPENGKGYDYEMVFNMDETVKDQKIQMDMSAYYSMEVAGGEADLKELTTTIDRFKIKTSMGAMNFEIDTDKPLPSMGDTSSGDPMRMLNKLFGAIKGQKFTMKVNAEGKVTEVKGFESMGNKLLDSLGIDGAQKEQFNQQFNKQFNAEQMQGQFDRILYIFPNKEVKVGDSWEKTSQQTGQMPGKYISKYTVSEIEGDMVTLDEDTKLSVDQQGANVNGKITGKIVVDSRSGLVVKADQDLKVTTTAEGTPIDIVGKISIKGKAR